MRVNWLAKNETTVSESGNGTGQSFDYTVSALQLGYFTIPHYLPDPDLNEHDNMTLNEWQE